MGKVLNSLNKTKKSNRQQQQQKNNNQTNHPTKKKTTKNSNHKHFSSAKASAIPVEGKMGFSVIYTKTNSSTFLQKINVSLILRQRTVCPSASNVKRTVLQNMISFEFSMPVAFNSSVPFSLMTWAYRVLPSMSYKNIKHRNNSNCLFSFCFPAF